MSQRPLNNAGRRHHIPKMSFKVRNWPAYEAGLRRRGSLTLRIEDAALECWQTIGPGGQARHTNAAIRSSLMLRAALKLALRQVEGLMTSVLPLMIVRSQRRVTQRQPSRGDVAGHPGAVGTAWTTPYIDRRQSPASLRSGSVA